MAANLNLSSWKCRLLGRPSLNMHLMFWVCSTFSKWLLNKMCFWHISISVSLVIDLTWGFLISSAEQIILLNFLRPNSRANFTQTNVSNLNTFKIRTYRFTGILKKYLYISHPFWHVMFNSQVSMMQRENKNIANKWKHAHWTHSCKKNGF